MDDDDLILAAVPSLLEVLGHRVDKVDRGAKAITYLETQEPDLVILDVTMLEMGGVETLARIRTFKPELPVLLATGNVDEAVEEAVARDPHARVIPKPFTLSQIRAMVQETGNPA